MASTFRRKKAGSLSTASHAAAGSSSATAPAGSSTTSTAAAFTNTLLLPGCKAWTAGTVLTSTGLRELDSQLTATTTGGGGTGGQPVGTCLYVEEDRLGDAASCLVRYWCAEVSELFACLLLVMSC